MNLQQNADLHRIGILSHVVRSLLISLLKPNDVQCTLLDRNVLINIMYLKINIPLFFL